MPTASPPALVADHRCNAATAHAGQTKREDRSRQPAADASQHDDNLEATHTHSAHFAGILALPPIPHAGNRKIKQPASLPGLGRLCAAMLMVLGGQQAIPGARHRPEPTGLRRARLGEKGSCQWAQRAGSAQGTGPSGLHGSTAMTRCFFHQPEALTCQPRRARPARLAAEDVSEAVTSRRWPRQ